MSVLQTRSVSSAAHRVLQARSNIARSGVTYSGWTPPNATTKLNGVALSTGPLLQGFSIQQRLDSQPSVATVYAAVDRGFTPVRGNDVQVLYTTPDDYLFAGTVLSTKIALNVTPQIYECRCVDYSWLIDQYALVLKRYRGLGVSTIVADILKTFTDPAAKFMPGYLDQGLGNLDIDFNFETVSQALTRIAKAVGGYLSVDARKQVSIFSNLAVANKNAQTLVNSTVGTLAHDAFFTDDISQIRTRTYFEGNGTTALAVAAVGASTLSVTDTSFFSKTGGKARSNQNLVSYTGKSTVTGAGLLTGCTGILVPIQIGDPVNVLAQVDNVADQTAFAAVLGSGLSGIAVHYSQDSTRTLSEATSRATADETFFGTSVGTVEYSTSHRWAVPGQIVTVNVSSPLPTVNTTFMIQMITITPRGKMGGGTDMEIWRRIQATSYLVKLTDLLRGL